MNSQLLTVSFWTDIAQEAVTWSIQSLPPIVLILIVALVASRIIGRLLNRASNLIAANLKRSGRIDPGELDKRVQTLSGILSAAVRAVVWLVIVMMILRRLGIDVAPIIAGAGIIGLAVGFGAQELVRDFIAGFFILLENQIRAGDVAIVNGTGGLVEHVGLRTVILRDLSGTVHVIQNGKIDSLSNMTKDWSAMVFDVGVAYKEDTDQVVAVMQRVAADLQTDETLGPDINEPLEVMGVDAFGDSAVVIKARLKTKPIRQWAVGREYRRRLKYAFDEAGIEIPFPHRTLFWGDQSPDTLREPEGTETSDEQ
ncbi:MAG: mechanosensitive ion channel family protein [Alkalispirochaeta sp.]